jgi:YbbR domain-containing protein
LAFGVWFVVTDVENPRTEGPFPADGSPAIRVRYVNVADGYVVADQQQVSVVIEAREQDFETLRPDDFTATVDMLGAQTGRSSRPVNVTTSADGVRVISVRPAEVTVDLREAVSKDVPVQVRATGSLPDGFEITEQPVITPASVRVTGLRQIVEEVERVEIPVDLTGRRTDFTETGRLEAVTESGNVVTPSLSQSSGTVSYKIEQQRFDRQITLLPAFTGDPAEGYIVTGVEVNPESITVTGKEDVIGSLWRSVQLEAVDVSGASEQVVQQKPIPLPEGVTSEASTATVTVTIARMRCGDESSDTGTVCGERTFMVAPRILDLPAGLRVQDEAIQAAVRVVGPLDQLERLSAVNDIVATVSLSGATVGANSIEVRVEFNQGFDDLSVKETPTVKLTLVTVSTTVAPP